MRYSYDRRASGGKPVENLRELENNVERSLERNHSKWEWTADLTPEQLRDLGRIITKSLWKELLNRARSHKRMKLGPPRMWTDKEIELFMPGQTRTYAPLVHPLTFDQ